ncbi:MAG TPA: ROK family protein [Ktedonobacteraceae bacterium]|nr:ROK family protein [Ktedonobacteraceae bacterium]
MHDAILANQESLPLVLGVDIGGTQLRASVLRGAHLLSRVSVLMGENPVLERTIPRIFQIIQQALDEAQVTLASVTGIGVATPGPLDNRTGILHSPPNLPGWERVPLRAIFQQQFAQYQFPIYIENDANTAALGEYMFGAGRGCSDMVYMTISTGIGGGVIIGGRLLEGASGTAAELGHMSIDRNGGRCNCGNLGCLEYYASGTAIARVANEAIAADQGIELLSFVDTMLEHLTTIPDQGALPGAQDMHTQPLAESDEMDGVVKTRLVNARTVARAAEAGIPLARDLITKAGEALGMGLVNIIHIFNPERIILGGGVTMMGDMLMEPALRITREYTMKAPYKAVRISLAELGINVGLVGAGGLVYYNAHS